MTVKEMQDKDDAALQHELKDKQKHLFDLRSQSVTEKLEDPTQLGKTKREIAQLKTELRARQIKASKKPAAASESTPVAAAAK